MTREERLYSWLRETGVFDSDPQARPVGPVITPVKLDWKQRYEQDTVCRGSYMLVGSTPETVLEGGDNDEMLYTVQLHLSQYNALVRKSLALVNLLNNWPECSEIVSIADVPWDREVPVYRRAITFTLVE